MSKRLHYVDWLRVLAVLLLFPFHTSRVFNYGEPFYIKSVHTSMALNYFLSFVDRWQMPLLFVLAGASTYLALSKRTTGQYLIERVKRLLVPLVFGIFVIMPPQTWVGAQYNSGYTGSFWQYISSGAFLTWNIQDAGDYFGGFGIGHLWFILFLFLISILALPIVVWGRKERGNRRVQSWSRGLAKPALWLLPPLALWLSGAFPEIAGKNLLFDLLFFVLGYVVIASDSFSDAADAKQVGRRDRRHRLHRLLGRHMAVSRRPARPLFPALREQLHRNDRHVDDDRRPDGLREAVPRSSLPQLLPISPRARIPSTSSTRP